MALSKKENRIVVENTITNTSVNVIQITEDKLENILIKHVSKLKRSHDWIGALALSVTLLGTLLTAEYRAVWIFSADVFMAIFVILFIASIIYLIVVLNHTFRNRESVESIIRDIKNEK